MNVCPSVRSLWPTHHPQTYFKRLGSSGNESFLFEFCMFRTSSLLGKIVWSSLLSKTSSLEKSFVLSMQKNCIFGQHIFLMAWLEHGGGRAADDLFHSAFFDREAHRDFSQKGCCRKSSLLSDASDCLKESWSSSTCICVLFSSASDF